MSLTVIHHEDPWWAERRAKTRVENGANTYSRDILTHHVHRWARLAEHMRVTVSTAPPLVAHKVDADLVVQYLHTYNYADPMSVPRRVTEALSSQGAPEIVFVSAYRPLVNQLNTAGYTAVYVPMRVDGDWIRHRAGTIPDKRFGEGRAVYFGNITPAKRRHHDAFVRSFRQAGWKLDLIGSTDQGDALNRVKNYTYGVGVGRCALEMMTLGMRVMVSGAKFGGIITNASEWDVQSGVNFNGRVITYDRTVRACVDAWGQVPDWSEAADTYTSTAVVDQHVQHLLNGLGVPSR